MHRSTITTITREEIKKKLANHYGKGIDRELVETEFIKEGPTPGARVFVLKGSPPKGYAICVPELRRISLYDQQGKRFRILDETVLEDQE